MTKPMLILVAGPYRSGTGDDPDLMARNLGRLEEAAWPIFRSGHVPDDRRMGRPARAPLGGCRRRDAPLAERVLYPTAERLLQHCDAVLRLPGESTGADQDVAIAEQRGIPVYHRVEEIPGYAEADAA